MRRCNLSCAYCNEYDKTSDPVAIDVMLRRIDKLAEFGTSVITISGGEPMMHPQIYDIIARIRHHGMIAGLISNGYYFQVDKTGDHWDAVKTSRSMAFYLPPEFAGLKLELMAVKD